MRASDPHKNAQIKETYAATKERRKGQACKVYTVKVQKNKINKTQAEVLKMKFVEAKWLYNHILAMSKEGANIFELKYGDITEVKHYDKDKNEVISKIKWLSSQQRVAIIKGIQNSIKGLAARKNNQGKVGALKFISEYHSLNLLQADISYKIIGKNKVRVQGIKKPLKVNGLKQILSLPEFELANAKLLNHGGDYFLAITTYVPRKEKQNIEKDKLGLDLGCQTSITTSEGVKYDLKVEETEQIKNVKRQISLSMKGSNNRRKFCQKLRKLNGKQQNRKKDLANKVCHEFSKHQIIMQDEQLAAWQQGEHGKAIMDGVLGRIKEILLKRDDTIVLSKWTPTTKLCTCCGNKVELSQWNRKFQCPHCGYKEDRDIHAAKNMLWFAKNKIGVGRTLKPDDIANGLETLFPNVAIKKQEATKSSDWW